MGARGVRIVVAAVAAFSLASLAPTRASTTVSVTDRIAGSGTTASGASFAWDWTGARLVESRYDTRPTRYENHRLHVRVGTTVIDHTDPITVVYNPALDTYLVRMSRADCFLELNIGRPSTVWAHSLGATYGLGAGTGGYVYHDRRANQTYQGTPSGNSQIHQGQYTRSDSGRSTDGTLCGHSVQGQSSSSYSELTSRVN